MALSVLCAAYFAGRRSLTGRVASLDFVFHPFYERLPISHASQRSFNFDHACGHRRRRLDGIDRDGPPSTTARGNDVGRVLGRSVRVGRLGDEFCRLAACLVGSTFQQPPSTANNSRLLALTESQRRFSFSCIGSGSKCFPLTFVDRPTVALNQSRPGQSAIPTRQRRTMPDM